MHTLVNSVRWNEAFVLAGHLPHREGERRGTDTCPLKLIYVGTKTELVRAFYAPEGFPVGLFLQPTQEGNDTRYHNIQYCFIVRPLENWSYLLCNLSWLEYDIKTFFGGTWKVLAHFFFPIPVSLPITKCLFSFCHNTIWNILSSRGVSECIALKTSYPPINTYSAVVQLERRGPWQNKFLYTVTDGFGYFYFHFCNIIFS